MGRFKRIMLLKSSHTATGVWDVLENSGSQREPGLRVMERHDPVNFWVEWREVICLASTLSAASSGMKQSCTVAW